MHRVEQAIEIQEKLNLSNNATARLIGVSHNSFPVWRNGERKPREASLQKVQRFIDEYESGTLDLPKSKQLPTSTPEDIDPEVEVMYRLIYKLENKYGGHLANVSEDDPVLQLLRKEVGVHDAI